MGERLSFRQNAKRKHKINTELTFRTILWKDSLLANRR